jgi:hypothetical protein
MFGHIDYSREWDMSRITGNPEVTGPEVLLEVLSGFHRVISTKPISGLPTTRQLTMRSSNEMS